MVLDNDEEIDEKPKKIETFEQKRRRLKVNYFEGGQNIYQKLATNTNEAKEEKEGDFKIKKPKVEKSAPKEPKREVKQKRKEQQKDDLL